MFNIYPYQNVNDLNLDYLIRHMHVLDDVVKNFVGINTIKYANPLDWSIASQYAPNTVVVDRENSIAYLSLKPVPAGVPLSNIEYWTPIFDLTNVTEALTLVTPQMYGAVADGVTNDTDAIRKAIEAAKNQKKILYFPEGTYLIDSTDTSGDFLLYLGTVNGLEICGTAGSVIKFADDVGRNKVMFGTGVSDTLQDLYVHDLTLDGNGANNVQSDISDPLRYNSAFYLYSPCKNVTMEGITFKNFSGHQIVRVGDTQFLNSDNVTIRDSRIENFGTAITGNNIIDVSAIYLTCKNARVYDCTFLNPDSHAFDFSKGETAVELHCEKADVNSNAFFNVKLPVLFSNYEYEVKQGLVSNNTLYNCGYLVTNPDLSHDTKIEVFGNIYESNKMTASSIIGIGTAGESNANNYKRELTVKANTIVNKGNVTGVSFIAIDYVYLEKLIVSDNIIKYMTGAAVFATNSASDLVAIIDNNIIDSPGILSPSALESDVKAIYIAALSTIKSVRITNNNYLNTLGKIYNILNSIIGSGTELIVDHNDYDHNINYTYSNGTFTYSFIGIGTDNDWYLVDTVTGNAPVNIPSDAKTVYVKVGTLAVTRPHLGTADQINTGWYAAANNFQLMDVRFTSSNTVYLQQFNRNGNDETATATVTVYCQK